MNMETVSLQIRHAVEDAKHVNTYCSSTLLNMLHSLSILHCFTVLILQGYLFRFIKNRMFTQFHHIQYIPTSNHLLY